MSQMRGVVDRGLGCDEIPLRGHRNQLTFLVFGGTSLFQALVVVVLVC